MKKKETIVFASKNKHKIEEVKTILFGSYEVITQTDIGYFEDVEENGKTFEDNALIKAKSIAKYLNDKNLYYKVLSDDTGLCVDSLGGRPGVHSARYVSDHNDKANRDKILEELKGKDRKANFTCVVVFMDSKTFEYKVGEGKTYGYITETEKGDTSFGYDCIFYSDDLQKTFGEATSEEKNSVSHRGKALIDLLKKIGE